MRICVPIAVMMVMFSAVSYSADNAPKGNASSAKIYVVYLEGGRSYVLEGVEGVDFNGVKCLKGRHADITWAKGKICYIPVDKISAIMEYDSLDQYMQDIQKYRDSQLK
ncbi:MAG: hypothetical protein ABSD58_12105 [Verrucomicrobiia bacterium]|jgi:hypothetical protein